MGTHTGSSKPSFAMLTLSHSSDMVISPQRNDPLHFGSHHTAGLPSSTFQAARPDASVALLGSKQESPKRRDTARPPFGYGPTTWPMRLMAVATQYIPPPGCPDPPRQDFCSLSIR